MKHIALLKSRAGSQGGLEKYASRVTNAFIARGDQVSIPLFSPKFPLPGFLRLEQFDRFVQNWLKNNKADIVFGMDRNRFQTHYRAGNGVHAAYLESRILAEGRAKVFLCKLNPLHRKILELERAAFENPSLQKLFTNSDMVRREIRHYYKIDPSKIQVIHNGVEWDEMQTDFAHWEEGKAAALQKFHLKSHYFNFLFIGNGYRRKGLDPLLIALSRLRKLDNQLSVIGKDKNIDLYRAKAIQLGLQNQVHFYGPVPDIRPFYQLADCLLIPSFYDPFANVTVEALAMGLFVVSSKTNGGHEILTPVNGAIIENLHPDAIATSLETALNHRKTTNSAYAIRQSVKSLDFSHQLQKLLDSCG